MIVKPPRPSDHHDGDAVPHCPWSEQYWYKRYQQYWYKHQKWKYRYQEHWYIDNK